MNFFVNEYCKTVQAGVVTSSMQDDNDALYCWIVNQPFHTYSSQHLSNFLSFHTLKNEIFRQRFL